MADTNVIELPYTSKKRAPFSPKHEQRLTMGNAINNAIRDNRGEGSTKLDIEDITDLLLILHETYEDLVGTGV